jgi:hypothetical protein
VPAELTPSSPPEAMSLYDEYAAHAGPHAGHAFPFEGSDSGGSSSSDHSSMDTTDLAWLQGSSVEDAVSMLREAGDHQQGHQQRRPANYTGDLLAAAWEMPADSISRQVAGLIHEVVRTPPSFSALSCAHRCCLP